ERALEIGCRSLGSGFELVVLALEQLTPAQLIDRAALGGGHQPRARVVGDARLRPALERGDQRLLGQVFGEIDVMNHAHEATEQSTALDAPDCLDGLACGGSSHDWE